MSKPVRPIVYVIGPSIAYVQLTRGYFALIDAEDGERVGDYIWYVSIGKGGGTYARSTIKRREVSLHRFILETDSPSIDHISRNPLDNRKANLRPASRAQNQANCDLWASNTSGYIGVHWSKSRKAWIAQINMWGKRRYLGQFHTPEKASDAYRAAAKEKCGEFFSDPSKREAA